jgi:iron complex outermembrane recepter protein
MPSSCGAHQRVRPHRVPCTPLITITLLLAAGTTAAAQTAADTTARRDSARALEAVTVRAIRGGDAAPISATTLPQAQLRQRHQGQDIPILLGGTPSLTLKSETGTHWGYSYVRLRGMEHRRLNFTLDGIPLNDPEDHVLYFTNFPDLGNSLRSVQVQRGVGTSSTGVAAYAGSVNLETVALAVEPRAADVQLQVGSFGSRRASASYTSGLQSNGLALYARGSVLETDGYRRHAGIDARSVFVSGGWFGARDAVKLLVTAGHFADTMAYTGSSLAQLEQDRRHNPLRPDERDAFSQAVTSLAYTRALGAGSSLATTIYRIAAGGDFDVCIDRCSQPVADLWNFNLDFTWWGLTTAWTRETATLRTSVGVNANTYARDHHAYARPDLRTPLYFNTGHKRDASGFAKGSWDVGAATLFGDLQLRTASFRYDPDAAADIARQSIDWTFVNPKVGVTWRLRPALSAYASYGMHTREPGREDMFAGHDNLDAPTLAFIGDLSRVRPERASDLEAGVRSVHARGTLAANVFDMRFRNEILPIGALSDIGTPLRKNVPSSYRRGVELEGTLAPHERVQLAGNATLMTSRIQEFTDRAGATYRDVPALLTPAFMSMQRATVQLWGPLSASAEGRYIGRSQLTNTNDPLLVLPATYVVDASVTATRGRSRVTLFGNNLGHSRGYSTGNVSSSGRARFFVLAPPNVHLLVQVGF